MEPKTKYKKYTEQLYRHSSKLIKDVSCTKSKFKTIYETSNKIIYEDSQLRTVELSTCEVVLKHENVSVYYRDNIIQLCANKISYIHDVVYIPNNQDYSFFKLDNEGELFQLSTIVDIKQIKFEDIDALNEIKDYFEYRYIANNT